MNYFEKIKEICEELETVEEEKSSIKVEVKEIDARIYIIEHEFKAIAHREFMKPLEDAEKKSAGAVEILSHIIMSIWILKVA